MSAVNIEIDFTPDDGPAETLYATLTAKELKSLQAILDDPDNSEGVVVIPSRTKRDGPLSTRVFRVGRTRIRTVPT